MSKTVSTTITEPILVDNGNTRYTLFPINEKFRAAWNMYKKMEAVVWNAQEVKLQQDVIDWETKLDENEHTFIKNVLAFFAGADGIVIENLLECFSREVKVLEVQYCYTFQTQIENVHAETYSLLIENLIHDNAEKQHLFNAIQTIPSVCQKAMWAKKWINPDLPYYKRLVAFAIVEGVFFSGSFCSIFWLKKRGLMPGLTFSNELISRDENMHVDLAVLIYTKYINNHMTQEEIKEIFTEAVEHEQEFITESLKCALIGMNAELMKQYIAYVGNSLIEELGHEPIFFNEEGKLVENPFDFMEEMSLDGKTNFFDKDVGEYGNAVGKNAELTFNSEAAF